MSDIRGSVWLAIRNTLKLEDLEKAVKAPSHTEQCIALDGIARDLTDAVVKKLLEDGLYP